jgi:multidrug efflux pump subunit AcrB
MKQASQSIQKIVSKLPEQVNAPKIDLKELQQNLVDTLTILSTYANYISRLEEQQNTIKSNLTNYQIRLKPLLN